MTRTDICALFGWTVDAFKGMQRHVQLPLEASGNGWTRFTARDAVKIAMTEDLAGIGVSRVAAARFVRAASEAMQNRWAEVVATGRGLFNGLSQDEFHAGCIILAFPSDGKLVHGGSCDFGVCFRLNEVDAVCASLPRPAARIVTTSASRSVAVVMRKAVKAGLELDWES